MSATQDRRVFQSLIGLLAIATLAVPVAGWAGEAVKGNEDQTIADAVEQQDTDALRSLLDAGADVNAQQPDGATALHWATHWDDLETVGLLLEAGADVNVANDLGVSPLLLACENGSGAMVARLLEAGADANTRSSGGEPALMFAARAGSLDAVSALINAGADVEAREPNRDQTALMWAAAQNHPDVTRALLAAGADPYARSSVRRRVVHIGNNIGDRGNYKGIVDRDRGGYTPLLFAARQGAIDVVDVLLEYGANPDDVAGDGTSAVIVAAHSGQGAFARYLLDKGADPNAAGAGYTALHAAVLRGDLALVEALLAAGAKVDSVLLRGTPTRYWGRDYALNDIKLVGATPLWLASRFGDVPLMRALATAGAEPNFAMRRPNRQTPGQNTAFEQGGREDVNGTTVLMVAISNGGYQTTADRRGRYIAEADRLLIPEGENERVTLATVKAAIELGADVNATDDAGTTALHLAASSRLDSVIQLLADSGADLNAANGEGQTALDTLLAPGGRRRYPGSEDGSSERERPTVALLRSLGAIETIADPTAEAPPLLAAEAEAFLGEWAVTVQGFEGPIELGLSVTDVAGNVAASLAPDGAEPQAVTSITKKDDGLSLDYDLAMGDNEIPVSMIITPKGDALVVVLEIMGGQFSMDGTAVRK